MRQGQEQGRGRGSGRGRGRDSGRDEDGWDILKKKKKMAGS